MKCNKQLKYSNHVAFSHFHGTAVNNSGLITQNEGYTYNPNAGCYFSDGTKQFYQREIDYIISKGYTFETTNDGFWRAIKK